MEAQFWSLEDPATPGYAARYGVPPANIANADFVEVAELKAGAAAVTRPAAAYTDPATGQVYAGGSPEVVVAPGSVRNVTTHLFGRGEAADWKDAATPADVAAYRQRARSAPSGRVSAGAAGNPGASGPRVQRKTLADAAIARDSGEAPAQAVEVAALGMPLLGLGNSQQWEWRR